MESIPIQDGNTFDSWRIRWLHYRITEDLHVRANPTRWSLLVCPGRGLKVRSLVVSLPLLCVPEPT